MGEIWLFPDFGYFILHCNPNISIIFALQATIISFENSRHRSLKNALKRARKIAARQEIDTEFDERVADLWLEKRRALLADYQSNLRDASGRPQSDWRGIFIQTRVRLLEEAERLRARSLANLTFGLFFTFVSLELIFILFFADNIVSISNAPHPNSNSVLIDYIPRFSLIVISQLSAAFFLRLYISNERDFIYNKNEITNIEQKFIALLALPGEELDSKISEFLLMDERNLILNKNTKPVQHKNTLSIEEVAKIIESVVKITSR